MHIQELSLHTRHLADQQVFYHTTLGLPLLAETADSFTIQAGTTRLRFQEGQQDVLYHVAFTIPRVQSFTVVDNSDFCPSRLTVHTDSPYDQEALHVSYFKRRGSVWVYTFSCFCSCASFSSLSRCFVAFLGLIFSFPIHQQAADARWSTVFSSPAPRLIAPSVVSPRHVWDLPLRHYAPGVR